LREDIAQLELKSAALEQLRPHPKPSFPTPKLRLKVLDLAHPGAEVFFANSNPPSALPKAVESVLSVLYEPAKLNEHIPPTKSVNLILRSMDGVAYTTGSDTDDNDKRIHFSLDYIHNVSKRLPQPGQSAVEIQGVLVHEMVHCWQWNGLGSAPGGLIEGIADYVRLKAGLGAAHWRRQPGNKWDAGYQATGYFLEWIEVKFGEGSIRRVNQALQDEKYEEEKFWDSLFGSHVTVLWEEYLKSFHKERSEGIDNDQKAQSEAHTEQHNFKKDPDSKGAVE